MSTNKILSLSIDAEFQEKVKKEAKRKGVSVSKLIRDIVEKNIPNDSKDVEAVCDYGDYLVTSVVRNGATTGCQFHPEKSGEIGLKILKNFINQ